MKISILILGAIVLIGFDSCSNNASSDAQTANPPDSLKIAEKSIRPDTVHYKDDVIHLEPIDSNDFLKLPAIDLDTKTLYYKTKLIDDSNVYFVDSIIPVLKFTNGDSVVLRPSQETSIHGEEHRYLRMIKPLNSFFISNPNDLSYDYSLWNKSTGRETRVYSYPEPSPDGQNLLCYDFCVNGDYANNGFQIFANERDSLLKRWQVIPRGWGPVDCRWKDDHTIYMKTSYWDWGSKNFIAKYVSLKLPDFSK